MRPYKINTWLEDGSINPLAASYELFYIELQNVEKRISGLHDCITTLPNDEWSELRLSLHDSYVYVEKVLNEIMDKLEERSS